MLAELWPIMDRCTVISKREIFYLWPFGLASWLWGTVFINRTRAKDAQETVNQAAKTIKTRQVSWDISVNTLRHVTLRFRPIYRPHEIKTWEKEKQSPRNLMDASELTSRKLNYLTHDVAGRCIKNHRKNENPEYIFQEISSDFIAVTFRSNERTIIISEFFNWKISNESNLHKLRKTHNMQGERVWFVN